MHLSDSLSEDCVCGHCRAEHFDFVDRIDSKNNKPYRQWVDKGLGKCLRCFCEEFRKQEEKSEKSSPTFNHAHTEDDDKKENLAQDSSGLR